MKRRFQKLSYRTLTYSQKTLESDVLYIDDKLEMLVITDRHLHPVTNNNSVTNIWKISPKMNEHYCIFFWQ